MPSPSAIPPSDGLVSTGAQASARAAPFVLSRAPRRAGTRRWAERAWTLYPPVGLLVVAALLMGGCQSDGEEASTGQSNAALVAASATAAEPEVAPEARNLAYPEQFPLVGTAAARATVRHGKNQLEIINLSRTNWTGWRVWLNQLYSAPLPHTKPGELRTYRFDWFVDEAGQPFPTANRDVRVEQVELLMGDERTRVRHGIGY